MNEEIWHNHGIIDARPLDQRVLALEMQLAELEKRVAALEERYVVDAEIDDEGEIDERILMDDTADINDPVKTLKSVDALDEIFPGFRQWFDVLNKIDTSKF